MAGRGANFRGTQRHTYNPREVKYLSEREARKEYQALRRIAMKRMQRLVKSGVQQPYLIDLPPSSTLTADEISGQLMDVSIYIRDPRSLVTTAKLFEERMQEAFKGSPIIQKDIQKFGDFMTEMRRRAGGVLKDSDRTREAYEAALSKGMRVSTLEKHFSEYMIDKEKAEKLAEAAKSFKGTRLTWRQLKGML